MERSTSNRWLWLAALLGVLGGVIGSSGYAMVASLSVAHPEQSAHWHRMAYAYVGVIGLSLISLTAALVVLWRRRGRDPSRRVAPPA